VSQTGAGCESDWGGVSQTEWDVSKTGGRDVSQTGGGMCLDWGGM
jgi:hypothetical protein